MPDDERSLDVFDEIDENLRRAYSSLLNEELPDRFKSLIQELKDSSDTQNPVSANTEEDK